MINLTSTATKVAGAILLFVLGALGAQTFRLHNAQLSLKNAEIALNGLSLAATTSALAASEAVRNQEKKHREKVSQIDVENTQALAEANGAADRATLAAQRLRSAVSQRITDERGRAKLDSVASQRAPGADALDLLADVLGRADERAQALAVIADTGRIRALGCERAYDAQALSERAPTTGR